VGTATLLGLGYLYAAAGGDWLARAMPPSMERQLGQGVLAVLDQRVFEPSRFSDQRMEALSARFRQLRPPVAKRRNGGWHSAKAATVPTPSHCRPATSC
jgi:hypothetical protein